VTFAYLWSHRERPPLLSPRWFVVWLKRMLTLAPLLRILFRGAQLRLRGARIGRLAILDRCRLEGAARRLSLGEGSVIGRGSYIVLHDRIDIAERVVINSDVVILTASHDLHDPSWRSYSRPVRIEAYAWVATGAMILPGVTVGRGAVVGAGAVVRRDVPAFAVVAGNPAQVVDSTTRTAELDYLPTRFTAPFEAWLGRP
jgi:acetyltransferase-like isoleucine patch superfamily enzyme